MMDFVLKMVYFVLNLMNLTGSLVNGLMDVRATFESGAVISYQGAITADMTMKGVVVVMAGGSNPSNFKPVGTFLHFEYEIHRF